MVCLSHDEIVEIIEGLADHARLSEVEAHLARCDSCRELVALGAGSSADSMASSSSSPSSASSPSGHLSAGQRIDHYEVRRLIGAGSMGEVYLALDTVLKRDVALKLIRLEALETQRGRQRFLFEARATARCHHPNIVTIFGVGEHEGRPYLALEHVVGQSLRQRIAAGRLSSEEATTIALAIARALKAAHAEGILHRDLKPENVMLTDQREVRVLDFGLAKSFEGPLSASGSSASLVFQTEGRGLRGTPAYMAPEQWDGEPATPAADVWALGVMIVELLKGGPPFRGNLLDLARGVCQLESELPSLLDGLPPALASLARRCLRQDPATRPTVQQVIGELETAAAPSKYATSLPWTSLLAVVLLATLGAAGWLLVRPDTPTTPMTSLPSPHPAPVAISVDRALHKMDAGSKTASDSIATVAIDHAPKRSLRKRATTRALRRSKPLESKAADDASKAPATEPKPRRRWVGEGLMDL